MPLQMSEANLVALIESLEQDCYGESDGTLANERSAALDRYNGALLGNEVPGRSAAISTDLRDTVEAVVPQLLRIFLSGDDVVRFDPRGPEDVAQAKLETDYINFVVTQRNNAFVLFSTWFRDALLQKNGYVKAWWETRSDVMVEYYQGQTQDSLAILQADPCVEIVGLSPYMDEYGQQIFDVQLRRKKETGYVKTDNVPCEEILVHSSHREVGLENCIFVEHRRNLTLSEIRQMGIDVPDDWAGEEYDPTTREESISRDRFAEITQQQYDSIDPATRRATYKEIYARIDEDGDGVAELRRICMVNRHVVVDEEADMIPFSVCTPVIQPHRHIGYGYYDFLKEIELAHTALLRVFFDNNYLSVNGRYAVNVDTVNVDDLLTSRPGGVVRTKGDPSASIFPITHPSTGETALSAMTYLDAWKKQATGVVMDSSVLSADILNKSTATGISQAISVWQARIEAVARCFAETGMKDLFRIVHGLAAKNATSQERVQLNQQWHAVDPREWTKRTDLTVTLGLGTGSKEIKVQFLQQALVGMVQGLQGGLPTVTVQNVYEMQKELFKEMGYRDADRFVTDPTQNPPQPKPPPESVQVAQIKAQADQAAAQQDAAMKERELQLQAQVKDREQQNALLIQQQNDARDDLRAQREHERELQRMAMEDARERERMVLDAQLKREEMQLKTQAAVQAAQVKGEAVVRSSEYTAQAAVASKPPPKDDGEIKTVLKELVKTASARKRAKRNPDGSWDVGPA